MVIKHAGIRYMLLNAVNKFYAEATLEFFKIKLYAAFNNFLFSFSLAKFNFAFRNMRLFKSIAEECCITVSARLPLAACSIDGDIKTWSFLKAVLYCFFRRRQRHA